MTVKGVLFEKSKVSDERHLVINDIFPEVVLTQIGSEANC
jgi:hypothetical protein